MHSYLQVSLNINIFLLKRIFSRAPTDCVQYFTGISGSVQNYNFAGGQMLQSQTYVNCIRTEKGYCGIQWKQSSTTSPDPFEIQPSTPASNVVSNGGTCAAYIYIPNLSPDGIKPVPVPPGISGYQTQMCGVGFGVEGGTLTQALVSKYLYSSS